ncbi:ribosome rescue GTPase HflX [Sansalvadorimonas verongulae]|uniref:ribosome rescue GTPase HflX n=1 Tax=Sansalvadorimonas verongulae TaxID=2172824 RepID=UPI0012BC85AD|nr:ribosome rescue GTPase HflX [Sansalvadorimonas verongulae]MTI13852.1 GTPase HflX [Sansalvadorimonas verongulae]
MFFERHERGERAVLVHPECLDDLQREDPREFQELVRSANVTQVAFVVVANPKVSPRYFVGSGKLEEIRQQVIANDADVVLFNHALSPSQERNLEAELQCRVVDRTGLILDIFAQRARTHEGKLQVELAQLDHVSTRLVRGWTHLERQKGGVGLRGPGETQLETDRRLLRIRIKTIQKRLEKVRKQRDQTRRSRKRADIPLVSLVGYTNAGKSTLFNSITESEVYAADQLFATLDPTLRRLQIQDLGPIILADTVGFIRHLPHKLVQAFRATLEESAMADLLLHVIDCADQERADNIHQVRDVLEEIDAHELPQLEVFNKTDLLGMKPRIDRNENNKPVRVWISAQNGEGLDLLQLAIAELLGEDLIHEFIPVPHNQGRLRARLYQMGVVQSESFNEEGLPVLELRMPRQELQKLILQEGAELPWELPDKEPWMRED